MTNELTVILRTESAKDKEGSVVTDVMVMNMMTYMVLNMDDIWWYKYMITGMDDILKNLRVTRAVPFKTKFWKVENVYRVILLTILLMQKLHPINRVFNIAADLRKLIMNLLPDIYITRMNGDELLRSLSIPMTEYLT